MWHYHDDDLAGPDAAVRLRLDRLPAAFRRGYTAAHYQVDRPHANSYAAWLAMGSPLAPNTKERAAFLKAAELLPLGDLPTATAGKAERTIAFTLPGQGVALIQLTAR